MGIEEMAAPFLRAAEQAGAGAVRLAEVLEQEAASLSAAQGAALARGTEDGQTRAKGSAKKRGEGLWDGPMVYAESWRVGAWPQGGSAWGMPGGAGTDGAGLWDAERAERVARAWERAAQAAERGGIAWREARPEETARTAERAAGYEAARVQGQDIAGTMRKAETPGVEEKRGALQGSRTYAALRAEEAVRAAGSWGQALDMAQCAVEAGGSSGTRSAEEAARAADAWGQALDMVQRAAETGGSSGARSAEEAVRAADAWGQVLGVAQRAAEIGSTSGVRGAGGGTLGDAESAAQVAGVLAMLQSALEVDTAAGQAAQGFTMAAAAQDMMQAAALGASAAQILLNSAMAACPLVWMAGAVLGVIALLNAACAAVSMATGTAVSGAGVVCGALAAAGALIANVFIGIWNAGAEVFTLLYNLVAAVADFVGTVFVDPVGAVVRLFAGMADAVLSVLQTIASAIDAVFGSNLSGAVQGWKNAVSSRVSEKYGAGESVMKRMDASALTLDRLSYGEAWDGGYALGQGFGQSRQIVGKASGAAQGGFYAEGGRLLAVPDSGDEVKTKVGRISGHTRAIQETLAVSGEDLRILREGAEMEAINRFTTAEIKIEQTNNNRIESPMDLDGIIDSLTAAMGEAVYATAEGVRVQ